MNVGDLDTVPYDQIDDGHSARDIAVLIGVLHQGETMGRGGIHPSPDVGSQKTIPTTHHDQVKDGEVIGGEGEGKYRDCWCFFWSFCFFFG